MRKLRTKKQRIAAVIKMCEHLDDADIVFFMANKERVFKDIISVLKFGDVPRPREFGAES